MKLKDYFRKEYGVELAALKKEIVLIKGEVGGVSSDFKLIRADWALFDASDFLRKFSINQRYGNRNTAEGESRLRQESRTCLRASSARPGRR